MKENKPTYEEAMAELEEILSQTENGALPIDALAAKAKRASELIKLCKQTITRANTEVEKILNEIK